MPNTILAFGAEIPARTKPVICNLLTSLPKSAAAFTISTAFTLKSAASKKRIGEPTPNTKEQGAERNLR